MVSNPPLDVAALFIRWTFLRAILHRGWWLTTSLYLVLEVGLTPFQLIFLGTAQGLTVVAFEVPTGVVADSYGRRRSLLIAHGLMGLAMLATGLVSAFPLLVLTQMLWGLSWTFSSGADVAWLTDELEAPERAPMALAAAARWQLIGAAWGLIVFGALAWATTLATAMITAGVGMWVLGVLVAVRFRETQFVPATDNRVRKAWGTLAEGLRLVRGDRVILVVLAVTCLVNGADEAFSRLMPLELVARGLPMTPDPVIWLAGLGLVTLTVGAVALYLLERHVAGERTAPGIYALASVTGAAGIGLFAVAPDYRVAMAGVVFAHGIAWTVTRVVSVIWVNRRTTSAVRATVQSLLSQAENLGEIVLGFSLALLATGFGVDAALVGSSALAALAAGLVLRGAGAPGHRPRL